MKKISVIFKAFLVNKCIFYVTNIRYRIALSFRYLQTAATEKHSNPKRIALTYMCVNEIFFCFRIIRGALSHILVQVLTKKCLKR